MTTTKYCIETFGSQHLPGALRLSQQAGWPHRAEDWALTLSVSGGVVALDGEAVVGTALCSRFGDVATLSMIIVDASMRGRGLGRELMAAVMDLAGAREMRLVATTDGLPLYEKLGFVACGTIAQHQGIALAATPERAVADGAPDPTLDLAASGMDRADLLARMGGEGLRTTGGFAVLRDFGRGRLVGPIVATDDAAARALLAEASRRCAGGFLRVDLARGLSDFAASLGLAHVGGGIAMVHRARPGVPSDFKTYALVSQALG
ncbi:GNAT family N-acetyltransferase [Cereibacter sp. SYSU M97828]|nr:GNAT family N-acetyltransferase [Cereibacter flavus]